MPVPVDFLQTEDGDLDFSRGLRRTPDLKTFVKQKLSQTLAFWQGEWALDTREGLPILKAAIGQRPDMGLVLSVYQKGILKTRGVGRIASLGLELNPSTRELNVRGEVETTEGDPVDLGPYIIPIGGENP